MAASVVFQPNLAQEQERIQRAAADVELPPGVRLVDVILDTDHTGDPAAYVHFRVSTKIPLTKTRVRSLSALKTPFVTPWMHCRPVDSLIFAL